MSEGTPVEKLERGRDLPGGRTSRKPIEHRGLHPQMRSSDVLTDAHKLKEVFWQHLPHLQITVLLYHHNQISDLKYQKLQFDIRRRSEEDHRILVIFYPEQCLWTVPIKTVRKLPEPTRVEGLGLNI